MPTKPQADELIENTTQTWTTLNGVEGLLFTGSNNKSIFLPALGERFGEGIEYYGNSGYYWTATRYGQYSYGNSGQYHADYIGIAYPGSAYCFGNFGRMEGLAIRPVKPGNNN